MDAKKAILDASEFPFPGSPWANGRPPGTSVKRVEMLEIIDAPDGLRVFWGDGVNFWTTNPLSKDLADAVFDELFLAGAGWTGR